MVKVLVLFYSTYGHIYKMAEAIAKGAREVDGAHVDLRRVKETLSPEILGKMKALESQKQFEHIAIADPSELPNYDVIFVG